MVSSQHKDHRMIFAKIGEYINDEHCRSVKNCSSVFSIRSHLGKIRTSNEDNFYYPGVILKNQVNFTLDGITENPCIFAVCDGMGGTEHGELASLTAVEILEKQAEKIKLAASSNRVDEAVQTFIFEANNKICEIMREHSFRMGTTLALVVISNNLISAYNIGDSRIYKFQNDTLIQISEDHTIAEQKIKMGLLTKEQARHDRSKHVLTRCLGIYEDEMILTPHIISPFLIDKNLRLLICSDGLTDMLTDEQIEKIMTKYTDNSQAVNELVNSALNNGGRDNITCIVIGFEERRKND